MEIKTDKQQLFKDNETTLKETSKDNSSKELLYMTQSQLKAADFDKVKSAYIRGMRLTDTPCSADALYCGKDNKVYLIEFKNGVMDKWTVYNVQEKIYTSLLIYTDIADTRISKCRENLNFILVYNASKNSDKVESERIKSQGDTSKRKIGKYFTEKGNSNFIAFGLEKFKNIYFENVYTYTEKEFEDKFVNVYEN